ncbi:MAG: D-tyrosyl-tRNA(Tyr) deacylase, partial [Thermoprotei archaeon]
AAKAYYLPQLDAVLAGYEEDVLYFEFLDKVVDASFYLILSRHKSEAGIKAFTVHHPGNPYREAKAGGKPLELPPSNPPLAKALLLSLRDARERMELEEFDVTYEVTHHGPTSLRKPVTFVEIGSSEREWIRQDARRAVAEAVIEALEHTAIECEPVVGVGGNHYASKFTARALATSEAYGHMIAKYALKSLTEPALIEEVLTTAALRSSIPTVKLVVEKKLRRAWREAAMRTAEKLGLQVEFV